MSLQLLVALAIGVVLGLASARRGVLGERARRAFAALLGSVTVLTIFLVGASSPNVSAGDVSVSLVYALSAAGASLAAAWVVLRGAKRGEA